MWTDRQGDYYIPQTLFAGGGGGGYNDISEPRPHYSPLSEIENECHSYSIVILYGNQNAY